VETWFWESWKSSEGGEDGYWNPERQETYQYFFVGVMGYNTHAHLSLDCTQFQINFQTPGQLPTLPEILRVPQNTSEILRHEYEVIRHSA